jgi:hypothetical protein
MDTAEIDVPELCPVIAPPSWLTILARDTLSRTGPSSSVSPFRLRFLAPFFWFLLFASCST